MFETELQSISERIPEREREREKEKEPTGQMRLKIHKTLALALKVTQHNPTLHLRGGTDFTICIFIVRFAIHI